MSEQDRGRREYGGESGGGGNASGVAPGKTSRSARLPVQRKAVSGGAGGGGAVGEREALPFLDVQLQAEQAEAPAEASGDGEGGYQVFKSARFKGDPVLTDIHVGAKALTLGDTGPAVTKVQAGLNDAGYAGPVDGTFSESTAKATQAFTLAKFDAGNAVFEQMAMWALDEVFADHKADAALARSVTPKRKPKRGIDTAYGKAPRELLAGTQKLDKAEQAEANALLAPVDEVDAATGKATEFHEDVGKGPYVDRLRAAVNAAIDVQYAALGAGKAEAHADPSKLFDMKDITGMATSAQAVTDAVFGSYAAGKVLDADRVKDRWATEEQRIATLEKHRTAGGKKGRDASSEHRKMILWRVQKIINEMASIHALNEEHGAVVSRAPEAAYIEQVKAEVAAAREHDLLEIQKGWPGGADERADLIYVQLFKSADAEENRTSMWIQFQTTIHEYLHTLTHGRYVDHVNNLKDRAKAHALREGMTAFLTEVVWSTVNVADPALRAAVEGPFHTPGTPGKIPALESYDAAKEAEQLVGLVGARNAYAAYFLGHVELIGGA